MKFFFLLFLAFSSFAKEKKITVAIQEHAGYSAQKSPGFLNDFIRELQKGDLDGIDFHFLPLKRAIKEYFQGNLDCMAGGDEKLFEFYSNSHRDKVFSLPYISYTTHLFSKGDPICSLEEMRKKSLIIIDNFPYKNIFKDISLSRIERAQNVHQAVRMAINERADAVISFYPTASKQLEKLSYCKDLYFTKSFGKIHCHKNKENEVAINKINMEIKRLKENGILKKLLLKHFYDYFKDNLETLDLK